MFKEPTDLTQLLGSSLCFHQDVCNLSLSCQISHHLPFEHSEE